MKRIILSVVIILSAILAGGISAHAQDKASNPLETVYNAYFSLKDALVKSNGQSAQQAAEQLYKAVAAVPMDKLSTGQHDVWMKYNQKLSNDAGQIKSSDKVDKQRKSFDSLSKNLYEVMKAVKPGKTVYWQHCPMYNKGANWLSLEKEIKNPYYGSAMLTCGSTVEELK